jgi:hypothetical protein
VLFIAAGSALASPPPVKKRVRFPPWFGAEQLWQIGDIGGAALRRGEQLLRPARRALEAEWQNGHTSA